MAGFFLCAPPHIHLTVPRLSCDHRNNSPEGDGHERLCEEDFGVILGGMVFIDLAIALTFAGAFLVE